MKKEQIELFRRIARQTFSNSSGQADVAAELCDVSLSALDAQGGEAVAWLYSNYGGDWTSKLPPNEAAEMWDIESTTPLYTHPSPAAVQALLEALEKLVHSIGGHEDEILAAVNNARAILKEQP